MTSPHTRTIAFIGGGQMAAALVGGLLREHWPADKIRVADPDPIARQRLAAAYPGVRVLADNHAAANGAGTWLLAVKPQQMAAVCQSLAALAAGQAPLVISIAAGTPLARLRCWLGAAPALVRCMPNRPALLGAGITGLHAAAETTAAAREQAGQIMQSVGSTVWLAAETELDAVTAVSGSGPAYLFLLMEMLEDAARREGLPDEVARQLAVETLAGAAQMARETGLPAAELRQSVTSPGGTTAAALAVLARPGWRETFLEAVRAARQRAAELAENS